MNTNQNTNKEENKMKKVWNGIKKAVTVVAPLGLVTGGIFIAKAALKTVGAEDMAEAIDEMGDEITEKIEEEVE